MIGLLTEGLRSANQTLITQGLASSFSGKLILFCPPMFSILLIKNLGFSIEKIQEAATEVALIQNINAIVSHCHDS